MPTYSDNNRASACLQSFIMNIIRFLRFATVLFLRIIECKSEHSHRRSRVILRKVS